VELHASLSVDLRRGGEEERHLMAMATVQDDLRATHIRGDRLDGLLDDLPHAHRGGEVDHHVTLADRLVHHGMVEDVVDVEVKFRVMPNSGQVV
jgi:hypothetical protein